MAIIYALIARSKKVILTEYTEYSGNFSQITLMILEKLEPNKMLVIDYDKFI